MAVVQNTYPANPPYGFPGQVANGELSNRISRTVESAAGIAFGQPAFRGAADHGCAAGATFAATGAGSAGAANVGTSTITTTPTVTAGAKSGRYTILQLVTSATGALEVTDPDGLIVAHGVVGTAITTIPGITSVTVTSAGTATAGDTFFVDVTYTANADLLGIVMNDHGVPLLPGNTADVIPQYDTAGILTRGTVFVTAGATVTQGAQVYWNPATSKFTATTTHIKLNGWFWDMAGADTVVTRIARR